MSANVWNRISSNHTHSSHNFSIKIIQIRKCLPCIRRIVLIWQQFITFAGLLKFGFWNVKHYFAYMSYSGFLFSYSQLYAIFFTFFFLFSSLSVRGLRLFCQCVIFTIYVLLCVCKSSHIYFICTVKSWGDFCILLPHRCKSAVKWFNSSKRFLLYTFITWTIMQFSWFYSAFSRSHSQ